MRNKRFFNLLLCVVAGCAVVTGLNYCVTSANDHLNGFFRKKPSHKIVGIGFLKLADQYLYLAGGDDAFVYLGNKRIKDQIIRIRTGTKEIDRFTITGLDTIKFSLGLKTYVYRGNVFLIDNRKPLILSGKATDYKMINRWVVPGFLDGLPNSGGSGILNMALDGHNTLVKWRNNELLNYYRLGTKVNDFFSSDGKLIQVAGNAQMIYVYYYQNKFLSLDSNLRITYTEKTIDTTSHPQIKIHNNKKLHQMTLDAPPKFVNKQASANSYYLFIHSAIKADNELDKEIKVVNPIDVYALKNGKYEFTIYLPNFDDEKLKDFRVDGNVLSALYDHYLYFYKLDF